MDVPMLKLSAGNLLIPQIGLGTGLIEADEVGRVVKAALEVGYRHFDCAYIYGNQKEIGEVLAEVFKEGKIQREDLFITSKVWCNSHEFDRALEEVDKILEELGLAYLDLYLIHNPIAFNNENVVTDVDYLETWRALEKCVRDGKIRAIGLANFNMKQIERVMQNSEIKPSVLEVEMHVHFQRGKLVEFCKERGIQVISFSSLTSTKGRLLQTYGSKNEEQNAPKSCPSVFEDPVITEIAKNHQKTNAQVVLRFLTQQYDVCVIPRSLHESRLRENFTIFDFELTNEELKKMCAIDQNLQTVHMPAYRHSPYYPYDEE